VTVLGVRFRFRATGFGALHCQRCGGDRVYRKCAGRRWVHVLYVPLVPLKRIGEHVQCTTCGTRYRLEVLMMPTMEEMVGALTAGSLAAAVAMLRADRPPCAIALARAVDFVQAAGLSEDDESLGDALLEAVTGDLDIAAPLKALSRQLVMPAPEWFLADVVRIGLADGPLSDPEQDAALLVAGHLGLTPLQARVVIRLTGESAAAGLSAWRPGPSQPAYRCDPAASRPGRTRPARRRRPAFRCPVPAACGSPAAQR
jgi:hypothetical protein